MARAVSCDSSSRSWATPHVDDTAAAVGSMVPGSLRVVVAADPAGLSAPGGSGSPGQVALLVLIGATVLDEVQPTPTGVTPPRSNVPVENVPVELASCPPKPAQASPAPARVRAT